MDRRGRTTSNNTSTSTANRKFPYKFRCRVSDKSNEQYDINAQGMMKNHLVMNYKR